MLFGLDKTVDVARDLSEWWFSQFSYLFKAVFPAQQASVLIIAAGSLTLRRLDGSQISGQAVGELASKIEGRSCDLAFAADRCLVRRISHKRLPHSRLLDIARADLASTPFDFANVRIFPVQAPDHRLSASYGIVKNDIIEPILEGLRSAGVTVAEMSVIVEGHPVPLSSRSRSIILSGYERTSFARRLTAIAVTATIFLAAATYGHLYFRYSRAEDQLASDLVDKRSLAVEVRKGIDRQAKQIAALEAARRGKGDAVPVVKIWEELTRVLPDTAWISAFTVDGNQLTFSGSAQSAAALIEPLEKSPIFTNPTFTSPVVKIPSEIGERFEIRVELKTS